MHVCMHCLFIMNVCLVQGFREPLYLTDKPVLLADDRTEEELKYPQLFQHRVRRSAATGARQRLLKE